MLRYDYKEFLAALGKRVKQLRKERGLTLRALVIQHGFHLTQIQRNEKGDGGMEVCSGAHFLAERCEQTGPRGEADSWKGSMSAMAALHRLRIRFGRRKT